jgi:hypothetical protein
VALPPLKLADINVGTMIAQNEGRPTPYLQRYLQDNNGRIGASITGVQAALAAIAAQQATLTAQQAQLTAQQATLTATVNTLAITVAGLNTYEYASTGKGGNQFSTTDGSGGVSFAHGFNGVPSGYPPQDYFCNVMPWGGFSGLPLFIVSHLVVDPVNLSFTCFDLTGAPLASTGVAYIWRVAGA